MISTQLGRLKKVALRDAWASEAADFTPWLAQTENLSFLAEAIGMDLELEAQEKNVGPYRADILCKDITSDNWVLIENQLERTDHIHLGQLLTYAAGLKVVTIIWIAEHFTDEHRAALDWLNEKTEESINFFGLEVELWKIGDSATAPKFNIVCKPNEWTRSFADSAKKTAIHEWRFEYWSSFAEQPELKPILTAPMKPNRLGFLMLATGWRFFKIGVWLDKTTKRLGVGLDCWGKNYAENYDQLLANKEALEKRLGVSLYWRHDPVKGKASINLRLPGNDPVQTIDWPRQHKLLAETTVKVYHAFDSFIQKLDQSTEPDGEDPIFNPKEIEDKTGRSVPTTHMHPALHPGQGCIGGVE